ncbi:RluA family pseudouridine synthase [Thiomicrorhabdus sp. zzn3]|uniref:RluA family pseudouridine synthase n=1 Tax=Thiomicrorhabdus sp. zzn3 TaxID=3039775 RepID=UPI0024364F5D|nr:RluA family pseudouridine synthase [Thiomicrorhabdus sp. zzn3]MDG6778293.1 RluA family pseudouridine synthase [Thiomicrorhabdus sp. zzn3]
MVSNQSSQSSKTSKVQFVEVTSEDAGQRVDNFLMRFLRKAPKTLVYRIIRKGEVRVNKGRVQASSRLKSGDVVRIPPVSLPEKNEAMESEIPHAQLKRIEDSILYEDKDLMVVNKPSGVAVHGGTGVNWGVIEVLRILRPHARRLELVHRIDRDTSGCLLVAKKASVLKALQQQIRDHQFEKRYLALIKGRWPQHKHKVDLPLRKDRPKEGGWHVVVAKDGKSSVSYFSVKQHLQGCDLVAVKLETGRTHQIRVHALSQGCPLVGDDKYGDRDLNKRFRPLGLKRLALHAHILGFIHPVTEERMRIEAPLWPDFEKIIERLALPEKGESS